MLGGKYATIGAVHQLHVQSVAVCLDLNRYNKDQVCVKLTGLGHQISVEVTKSGVVGNDIQIWLVRQIEDNAFEGYRKVIDVSGDGSSSVDTSERERDRAISRGITINGLVIFNKEYDLGELAEVDLIQHYSNQVIGGNGAFLMTAKNFGSFRIAIKNKLLREILGTSLAALDQ